MEQFKNVYILAWIDYMVSKMSSHMPHREPHIHWRGNIGYFLSTPRNVCPMCDIEQREETKRLHALLRTTA